MQPEIWNVSVATSVSYKDKESKIFDNMGTVTNNNEKAKSKVQITYIPNLK